MPPLEFCRGTSPSQAETCRPFLKLLASAIDATSAVAASGPMPGIFSSLQLWVAPGFVDTWFRAMMPNEVMYGTASI